MTPPNYPGRIWTNESNWFAHDTMSRRLPETIKRIQDTNPDYPDSIVKALGNLSHEIQFNEPIRMLSLTAPDYIEWLPAVDTRKSQAWLDTDWFFAETYAYRRIIECVRWWETGRDPFTQIKQEEYSSEALWDLLKITLDSNGNPEQRITQSINQSLWGNRIDLSFAASLEHGTTVNDDDLIVDDTAHVVEQLLNGSGMVHVVTDNAGTELAMDLGMVDALLEVTTATVILHVKMHPTFVSDAIPTDIWQFLSILDEHGGLCAEFGRRLKSAFDQRRLFVLPHLFWNSAYSMWQTPSQLKELLDQGRMIIIKGDANYRRLVGDGLWAPETPFAEVVGYFNAPVLALRTLKSDPIVGLPPGMANQLEEIDENWRINGKRGVIQYKNQAR